MGLRPAKSHEKLVLQDWWGGAPPPRPPPAAAPPVVLLAPRKMLMSLCRLRDQGGVRPTSPRGCGFSTLSRSERSADVLVFSSRPAQPVVVWFRSVRNHVRQLGAPPPKVDFLNAHDTGFRS